MQLSTECFARAARSLLAFATAALLLAGCSGGGDSPPASTSNNGSASSNACADCGALLIGLTDADGDFVSYSVDVLSIKLKRLNGASVETLPATARVDFAQLTDLSDLLSVATLAPGDFVGGTIRLDFTNAEIFVEKNGDQVQAKVVDQDGKPLGQTDLEIRLADRDHLVITKGRAAFLAVDFDLEASNVVDMTQDPPVVTARPFVVAEVQPVEEKDLRVRGALVSVDTAASSYQVDVRPWHLGQGNLGRVTVHTTAQTSFEIDGTPMAGSAGLAALAQKPAGTLAVAFGTLTTQTRDFTAQIVHAGTSVSGEGLDAVSGNVVSRLGDVLTVKGAFAVRHDHDFRFRRTVLVQLGADTKVLKTGTMERLTPSAISVGQSIVAIGTLKEPPATTPTAGAATTTPPTLDATAGRVRLVPTELHGSVNSVVAGQLDMNLRAIDRLGIEMFDFAGTGTSAATDADPKNYEILTGTMSLSQLSATEAAKVIGFVMPFGSAPPDFDGRTVIDRRDLPSVLGIGWGVSGTTAPFVSMGPTGLVIDIHNPSIGERHFLEVGMRHIDLLTLPSGTTIAPSTGRAVYGIEEPGHIELFEDFSDFVTGLTTRLGANNPAAALTATGSYDEGSNTLTANRVSVHFADLDADDGGNDTAGP